MINLLAFQLFFIDSVLLLKINVGLLGFFITPIIPTSYQIGCEIGFPVGEAQITGLLNGGALVWAFISDFLLTLIIGFESRMHAMVFIMVLIVFISIGNYLAFKLKIVLKRKNFEDFQALQRSSSSTRASDT